MAVTVLLAAAGLTAVGHQVLTDLAFEPVHVPSATSAPSDVAQVLAQETGAPAPLTTAVASVAGASPDGISRAVAALLTSPSLGGAVAAEVLDPAKNQVLFSANTAAPVSPASTLKLLTAAAVLSSYRPTDRIVTKVVSGSEPGEVVLVGAGDPTLSAAPDGQATPYAAAARVTDLAKAVRKSLGSQAVTKVVVDGSLFTGPATAAGWAPEDVPTDYATRITAALVDGGRAAPGDLVRADQPDLAAGAALAAALGGAQVSRGTAPTGARVLGQVSSAPYGRLVEQMLTESDNVLAEVLGRRVALARGLPATFAGAARAVQDALEPLGVPVHTAMYDASGLSTRDRIPAAALADVLRLALDPAHPELQAIVSGLPVAGWSGTLANRYSDGNAAGQGSVRAKTGTLDGVSALAGVVHDRGGQDLVVVLVANRVPLGGTEGARAALDAVAATLADCGCQ